MGLKIIGYDSDSCGTGFKQKKVKIKKKTGFCCYCNQELNKFNYTREHVHPKSLGGRITKPCCLTCNREKGDMTLVEYQDFIAAKQSLLPIYTLGFRQCETKLENINRLINEK